MSNWFADKLGPDPRTSSQNKAGQQPAAAPRPPQQTQPAPKAQAAPQPAARAPEPPRAAQAAPPPRAQAAPPPPEEPPKKKKGWF